MSLINKIRKVVIGDNMGDLPKITDTTFKYGLGDKVKDAITGFEGIITLRSQWLNACNTYGVTCTELKDGVPQDKQHFDEPQLSLVEEEVHEPQRATGGPHGKVPSTTTF